MKEKLLLEHSQENSQFFPRDWVKLIRYLNYIILLVLLFYVSSGEYRPYGKTKVSVLDRGNIFYVDALRIGIHDLGYFKDKYKIKLGSVISFNQIRDLDDLNLRKEILVPLRNGLYQWRSGYLQLITEKFEDVIFRDKYYGIELFPDLVIGGRVTSGYGERPNPFLKVHNKQEKMTMYRLFKFNSFLLEYFDIPKDTVVISKYKSIKKELSIQTHSGVDYASVSGTPIFANYNGAIVYRVGRDKFYGNFIELFYYEYKIVLAHLQKMFVSPGDVLTERTLIGLVGSTGRSTGPHLHFEVRLKDKEKRKFVHINPDLFWSKNIQNFAVVKNE